MAIITLLIVSIFCTSIVQSEENSSDFISLESGVLVSGYVTESDKSNPEDQYVIQVSKGDVVEFTITSEELIDFCVYLAPTGQKLVCYYEMNNRDEITFVKKESTEGYVININCESTSYECSESADYTLLVTVYTDEAGDYIEDSTPIGSMTASRPLFGRSASQD